MIMTNEELNAATEGLQFMLDGYRDKNSWEGYPRMLRDGIAAITTLRAQLAEATKLAAAGNLIALELRVTEGLVEEQRDRADRAEAALAAQIEVDAEIVQFRHDENQIMRNTWVTPKLTSLDDVADEIRNQPHDRTALERHDAKTREKALREAAETAMEHGVAYMTAHKAILALIGKEPAHE
jgi:hypothetical protein